MVRSVFNCVLDEYLTAKHCLHIVSGSCILILNLNQNAKVFANLRRLLVTLDDDGQLPAELPDLVAAQAPITSDCCIP